MTARLSAAVTGWIATARTIIARLANSMRFMIAPPLAFGSYNA
jgi:hypothetical protein